MATLPNSLFHYSTPDQNLEDHYEEPKLLSTYESDFHRLALLKDVDIEMPQSAQVEKTDKKKHKVLIVGQLSELEFPGLHSLLKAEADLIQVEAHKLLANSFSDLLSFDLVLSVQTQQVSCLKVHDQISEAIQQTSAETILIQLLGNWCEGEGRTGKVPNNWERVFWHAMPRWWDRWSKNKHKETNKLVDDGSDSPDSSINHELEIRKGLRIIEAVGEHHLVEAIHSALIPHGFYVKPAMLGTSSLASEAIEGSVAGIWIGNQFSGHESETLRKFCQRFRRDKLEYRGTEGITLPVVALLDFPRRETVSGAADIGVSEVVGLPCDTNDLVHAIERAIENSAVKQNDLNRFSREACYRLEEEIWAA